MKSEVRTPDDQLQARGLRPTRTRRLLLRLFRSENGHLSSKEIQAALQRDGSDLGTATIYQNLKTMVEARVLDCFLGSDGLVRYDANLDPHHHWICTACGRIYDVAVPPSALEGLRALDPQSGSPLVDQGHDEVKIEFRGICPRCRE